MQKESAQSSCQFLAKNVQKYWLTAQRILIVLGFNDMSVLLDHYVSSSREREKRDRRDSRGDEREGLRRRTKMNKREKT